MNQLCNEISEMNKSDKYYPVWEVLNGELTTPKRVEKIHIRFNNLFTEINDNNAIHASVNNICFCLYFNHHVNDAI